MLAATWDAVQLRPVYGQDPGCERRRAAEVTDERSLFAVSYPNYARADNGRANQITRPLVFDEEVRQALLPGTGSRQLALVLDLADRLAQQEGPGPLGLEGLHRPRRPSLHQRPPAA